MGQKSSPIISELQNYLKDRVKFALIYGSVFTDYFNEDSDIDIGIYLGRRMDAKAFFDLKEKIDKDLAYKYAIDLVVLDMADPIIAMQILANGKLIVENDREAFIKYKASMISQYIDFKRDRKIIEDRIAEGSIYV